LIEITDIPYLNRYLLESGERQSSMVTHYYATAIDGRYCGSSDTELQ
jgi:hypothetical protein